MLLLQQRQIAAFVFFAAAPFYGLRLKCQRAFALCTDVIRRKDIGNRDAAEDNVRRIYSVNNAVE